jgi:hypothetical protein
MYDIENRRSQEALKSVVRFRFKSLLKRESPFASCTPQNIVILSKVEDGSDGQQPRRIDVPSCMEWFSQHSFDDQSRELIAKIRWIIPTSAIFFLTP